MIEHDETGPLRVAILSDTHGALDFRVADVVTGCDVAVHGGDIGDIAVLGALQPRAGRILAVCGNNDRARRRLADEPSCLCTLPEVLEVPLPGGTLVVIHGHQVPAANRHQSLRRRFPAARAIVYGHSHHMVVDTDASPWVLNPGAAGRVRTYGGPSCLILTARKTRWAVDVRRFAQLPRGRRGLPRPADNAALSV
jgi:putative phosphoesterase